MVSVYNTLIDTCKYKQLNYKRYVCNNNTAVHVLGHEGKGFISSEMNKRLKNGKNDRKRVNTHKNIQKRPFFKPFLKTVLSYKQLSHA